MKFFSSKADDYYDNGMRDFPMAVRAGWGTLASSSTRTSSRRFMWGRKPEAKRCRSRSGTLTGRLMKTACSA